MREPEGVTVEDGPKLRHETTFLIMDGEKLRVLKLRVGRGVIRELDREHIIGGIRYDPPQSEPSF